MPDKGATGGYGSTGARIPWKADSPFLAHHVKTKGAHGEGPDEACGVQLNG